MSTVTSEVISQNKYLPNRIPASVLVMMTLKKPMLQSDKDESTELSTIHPYVNI